MSVIHAVIHKFVKGASLDGDTYLYGPFNAEDLNGAQWFLKYTNAEGTEVTLILSNYEAHGRDYQGSAVAIGSLKPPWTDPNAIDGIVQLVGGDNSAAGFFAPTIEVDRPFKSFMVQLDVDDTIDDVHFSFGRHGTGD